MREMRGVLDGWLCIGWMVVRGCVCTGKQGGVSPCTLGMRGMRGVLNGCILDGWW